MLQPPCSCQFIGVNVPLPEHVDLAGEASQLNSLDPDVPGTDGNGIIDGLQAVDHGAADFAVSGSEQHAFAEYLAHFHVDRPFSMAETPVPKMAAPRTWLSRPRWIPCSRNI